MAITKKARPRNRGPKKPLAKDWRDALRRHLSKVPEVDAVYVSTASATVHVYSYVEDFHTTNYRRLIRQEDRVEKEFPEISFEFHATAHQGRKPTGKEPNRSELIYLRS
jgi:hypothetical protein